MHEPGNYKKLIKVWSQVADIFRRHGEVWRTAPSNR